MDVLGRGRRIIGALSAAVWLLFAGSVAAQDGTLEYAVKAAYLYKLAPFVDWPVSTGAGDFGLCVIGRDPFGALLDRAVTGQRIGARTIVVRRLATASRDMPCQIAFVGGSQAQSVKDALRLLRGAPVLTVTDGAADPGVVDFVLVGGRVRFRIDEQCAADDGLAISSKLLSLATAVKPKKAGPGP